MLKFLLIFVTCLMVLFTVELLNPVQAAVIQPFTAVLAWISASIILPLDDTVISSGRVLRDSASGFAVSIEAGCNGVEASIVLIAGVLGFPCHLASKGHGHNTGLYRYSTAEHTAHCQPVLPGPVELMRSSSGPICILWPVLIMLDVLLVFALYLRWLSRPDPSPQHA